MISSVEYFLQDFANGGHADNGDFLGHLDTCQGIFGGIDLGKPNLAASLIRCSIRLTRRISCQTDFAHKALLWVGWLVLVTGSKGNCDCQVNSWLIQFDTAC